MKKLLSLLVIASFIANGQSNKQLDFLKEAVENQQKQIDELKKLLDSSKDANSASITLGSYTDSLKFSGDLRLRYETRERSNASNRHRLRQRFRLGFEWKTQTAWSFKAGLATGNSDAISTNDTLSNDNPFDTGDIRLDYASAVYKTESGLWTLGQQKNPLEVESIFFDSDIRPVGVSYKSSNYIIGGFSVFDATSASDDNGSFGTLFAAQIFGKVAQNTDARLGIFHYTNKTFEQFDATALNAQDSSEYTIIDLYSSTQAGDFTLWANVAYNVGADDNPSLLANDTAEDNALAYNVGVKTKVGAWGLSYSYIHIEADSLVPYIKDSNFGSGGSLNGLTDIEGHKISIKKKLSLNAQWALTVTAYSDIIGGSRDVVLIQSDFVYKF